MQTTTVRPIGKRNQVTIPHQLLKRLGLHPGDFVNFIQEEKGILLKPVEVVEKEEAWTEEELEAMERLFKEQKRKKEYIRFSNSSAALKYLRKIIKKKQKVQILYFNSFLRLFKKLPTQQQNKIKKIISNFISCLQKKTHMPLKGIGLKKLTKDFWEIRVGLDLRVLFTIEQDTLSFVFVGTHDEIKRYLKTQ